MKKLVKIAGGEDYHIYRIANTVIPYYFNGKVRETNHIALVKGQYGVTMKPYDKPSRNIIDTVLWHEDVDLYSKFIDKYYSEEVKVFT